MLNVPSAIKALFRSDSAHKNFRVHFPNGEYSDITNSQVLRESVQFTETACSQNVFRYGLTEASEIEFETVGVGNMYRMIIECSIEIDTSSLSAAQIAAIQADPGDGTLVLAADSDIGHGFYRVPYGKFKVASCPRNQQSMTHRRVTAYSLVGGKRFQNSPYELNKLSAGGFEQKNYTPSVPLLAMAAMGWASPSILDDYTKQVSGTWTTQNNYPLGSWSDGDHEDVIVEITGRVRILAFDDLDALYNLDMPAWDYDAVEEALDWVEEKVSLYGGSGSSAKKAVNSLIKPRSNFGYKFTESLPVFYPYFVRENTLIIPMSAAIKISHTTNGETQTTTKSITMLSSAPVLYKYATDFDDIRITVAPTGEGGNPTKYIYTDTYDILALINGWTELFGIFARPTRSGGVKLLTLDDSNPEQIILGDIEEMWWDEYDVNPVGSVRYSFGSGTEAQEFEYVFGPGESVYDMTENYLLEIMQNPTQEFIEGILASEFVPRVININFTPVQMSIRALPWIEASDALAVTVEGGAVVNTFAMAHSIGGIQQLMDSILSKGGEPIGEEG